MIRSGGGAVSAAGGSAGTGNDGVLDFGDEGLAWQTVDDRVMGGSSRSRVVMMPGGGGAAFEGDLVVNGGGFASVRCAPRRGGALGAMLRGAKALVLVCSGDGRRGYKLLLKVSRALPWHLIFSPP